MGEAKKRKNKSGEYDSYLGNDYKEVQDNTKVHKKFGGKLIKAAKLTREWYERNNYETEKCSHCKGHGFFVKKKK
jgi:hypothetical protein